MSVLGVGAVALVVLSAAPALANQTGINGRSGKYNGRFCITCHTGGSYATSISISGPQSVAAGQRASYLVRVSTNGLNGAVGFNAAVERQGGATIPNDPAQDPHDDDDGTLFAIEAGTQLLTGEVTHTAPRPVDSLDPTAISFAFAWEPHEAGAYTLYAAGNAVDLTGTDQNDHPALAPPFPVTVCADDDRDAVCNDGSDTCPDVPNPVEGAAQPDCDGDGVGDACDSSCGAEPACAGRCFPGSCGDGLLDAGEDCDDGDSADTLNGCSAACRRNNTCGDGVLEDVFEVCDDGALNSDTAPDACRTDCTTSTCGDGVVGTGEQCDDGDTSADGNGCGADCAFDNTCGDGVLEPEAEDCDDGNASADGNGCGADCRRDAVCGNGNLEALFEDCDDGNTSDEGNGCGADCRRNDVCGDAILADLFETCDDGDDIDSGNGCGAGCQRLGTCGDGVRHSWFEECDDGPQGSDVVADACRLDCTRPSCGDGVVDSGEACDDGGLNSDTGANACRTDCTSPSCGDGVVDAGESCDSGALLSATTPDACRPGCVHPRCGDGVLDPGRGEGCDDGDLDAGDGCSPSCVSESCGDDRVDGLEECDDGVDNSDVAPDACRTLCVAAFCGDGVVDSAEGCDEGTDNSDLFPDACRSDCHEARCGDGVVDSAEQCDPASSGARGRCGDDCTLAETAPTGCAAQPGSLALVAVLLLARGRRRYWRSFTSSST